MLLQLREPDSRLILCPEFAVRARPSRGLILPATALFPLPGWTPPHGSAGAQLQGGGQGGGSTQGVSPHHPSAPLFLLQPLPRHVPRPGIEFEPEPRPTPQPQELGILSPQRRAGVKDKPDR